MGGFTCTVYVYANKSVQEQVRNVQLHKTALANGTPVNELLFAVVFLSALYWASYRMNEL